MSTFIKTSLLLGTILTTMASASAEESLEEALMEGNPYLDARYRFEYGDRDNLPKDAHASTLRTRLGYDTGEYYGFSGKLEFENIAEIGNDNYNNTINGKTNRPVVADVETTEVNQAYLQYDSEFDTRIRAGRQRIILGNERFVGDVGFRQNNQTFDGVNLVNTSLPDTEVFYGYVYNVNRIFGDDSPVGDFDANIHLLNVSNSSIPYIGTLTGYGYWLDIQDAAALSSFTFGTNVKGEVPLTDDASWVAEWYLEYARQSDHGDNPVNYDANYYHIAPAISWNNLKLTFGYEELGSDNGTIGFSTPLATLHRFNGWSDAFLSTPAVGLEDRYVKLNYKFSGLQSMDWLNGGRIQLEYHDIVADEGGADFGRDIGAEFKLPIGDNYYFETQYAQWDADTWMVDFKKWTIGFGVKF